MIALAGALLCTLLLYGGSWLLYKIFVHEDSFGSKEKAELINLSLAQYFLMLPLVAVIVGIVVGWNIKSGIWWLACLSFVPVLIASSEQRIPTGPEIFVLLPHVLLNIAASFVTWRLRKQRRVSALAQV